MSVPDAAVNFLLNNLTQIVVHNYGLIRDIKPNIDALHKELESLSAVMSDFEKYNHDINYVKHTVREIRRVIGQAEDAVETYLLQAAVKNSRGWVQNFFGQFTDPMMLWDVGNQINTISAEIKKINEENVKNSFAALQYEATNHLNLPAKSKEAPKVEEDHVIGFDDAADEVERLLTGSPEKLEIVSIVGMLGLGKTTLARKVFKDPDVDYEFMIRAFVYVSKEFDRKDIFLEILKSFTQVSEEVKNMTGDELEKYVYKQLEGKQYLVVLDDVWEKEDWDEFKRAFPDNKKRCRVLITTRNDQVADYANPKVPPYRLDFLSLPASRELLAWRVFNEKSCPKEVLDYEIEIARKCDGLPLAVVVIAGIIWNHREKVSWWKDVADSVKNYIARDQKHATSVIELMYKHLPNYLKPCFLYLGVFREDFEIPVWKLIRLWIAEGLIQPEGNENLEDLAEVYLDELVDRNLVMVGQRRSNGKIKTCRMHDTLREFCKNEAAEENLFQEIKKGHLSPALTESPLDARRLCLNNADIIEYMSQNPSGKCVRSFLTFVKEETTVEPKLVSCLPKTFKLLRVLEIQSLTFTRFPVDLGNLILLKYIAISSKFPSLPASMSHLWCLQTLIVQTTNSNLDIKADIWKMSQFRHLHTNASTILPLPQPREKKTKEESLAEENLQTLSTISPESCTKEVFDRAPNLKKLGISGDLTKLIKVDGESTLFEHLRRLESLENLKLLNEDVSFKLSCLPSDKSFPKHLKKLTLMNTLLAWKEMSTLGKLEYLEVLKLKEYAFEGKCWDTEKGGFCRLKHLYIGRMDLVVWEEASVDHFPVLNSLELNGCDKLSTFPHRLADIPSFQLVVLHCTNTAVASLARKLQVVKLNQGKKAGNKKNNFKLSIYPPEH
ncbi:OLC1v1016682C2 [Oldenlandia corymbosa var. corymbosa]|uniref:OLC1v1016682C2 n=1 Tax=Oldenlandia corymbosa var. corymbosa TaxID=529605 RepID=A0AAV1E7Q9_OLDCO|nr:OLC1v1016682C2 [Oldenlandia corymbosa var. corymbosa]